MNIYKKLLIAVCSAIVFYFLTLLSIELVYGLSDLNKSQDFNMTWMLYVKYLMPFLFLTLNLFLCFLKRGKQVALIAFALWILFVAIYWGNYLFTIWPYRSIPILLIISTFYAVNARVGFCLFRKIRMHSPA